MESIFLSHRTSVLQIYCSAIMAMLFSSTKLLLCSLVLQISCSVIMVVFFSSADLLLCSCDYVLTFVQNVLLKHRL